jgi:hypothetical protein
MLSNAGAPATALFAAGADPGATSALFFPETDGIPPPPTFLTLEGFAFFPTDLVPAWVARFTSAACPVATLAHAGPAAINIATPPPNKSRRSLQRLPDLKRRITARTQHPRPAAQPNVSPSRALLVRAELPRHKAQQLLQLAACPSERSSPPHLHLRPPDTGAHRIPPASIAACLPAQGPRPTPFAERLAPDPIAQPAVPTVRGQAPSTRPATIPPDRRVARLLSSPASPIASTEPL